MDSTVNFSRGNMPIQPSNQGKVQNSKEGNCFENTSWCDSAADAVCEAFSNMDDFLLVFKESQG